MIKFFLFLSVLATLYTQSIFAESQHSPLPQSSAQDVCFARWEWRSSDQHWQAPLIDNLTGSIDLRSIPQMSRTGSSPEGWGLFVYDEPMGSTGMHCLGNDLDAPLTTTQVDTLAVILGLPSGSISSNNLRDIIGELLTVHADPTGDTRWKPVRISRMTDFEVHLGGYSTIIREDFRESHPAFQATLDVRIADYRRNKEDGVDLVTLQKWTGFDSVKLFGRYPTPEILDRLLPPEYRDDGWLPPETTITESWDCPGSDSPDCDLDWTELDNGEADWDIVNQEISERTTGGTRADKSLRAEVDLSTDNQSVQIDATVIGPGSSGNTGIGPAARFSATQDTYYGVVLETEGDAVEAEQSRSLKVINNGSTTIIGALTADPFSLPDTVGIEVEDSTVRRFINGVLRDTVTDTSITGNLRTGVTGAIVGAGGTSADLKGDNFVASDIQVAQVIVID